jgi:hypothetical protein
VTNRRVHGTVDIAFCQGVHRIPIRRNIFHKPASSDDKVIVHQVATRILHQLDEIQRRLFAESTLDYDPNRISRLARPQRELL